MSDGAVLMVGSAGYIGSHMVKVLCDSGRKVVVLDSLVSGHSDAVAEGATIVEGEMADRDLLDDLFQRNEITAVMYFAAFIEVGESVRAPGKYYGNNVAASLVLLEAMVHHGVKTFIFSSTAAVYGEPCYTPTMSHILANLSTLTGAQSGWSKRSCETTSKHTIYDR